LVSAGLCTDCGKRKAFFFRPYSGEKLCRKCFSISIEKKVRATLSQYEMLEYDDRIAVAVSGGKDSISLLHILTKIESEYPGSSVVAITVDEGIKNYRDEALRIAIRNCEELSLRHVIVSFEELYGHSLDEIVKLLRRERETRATSCAYCGVLRRKALNIAAREVEADKIATAHTLDDETQTILLNILHGSSWRLAKGKPVTDQVHPLLPQRIKPFCRVPERESSLYAYIKGIEFQGIPCPYASEAMRNDVRRFLNRMEEKHPGTKFTIYQSMQKIRPGIKTSIGKEELNTCTRCGEPTSGEVCRACKMLQQLFET
ncbi:MAG: TIGR00269 family protein, partial [Thermoproteota archaeon]